MFKVSSSGLFGAALVSKWPVNGKLTVERNGLRFGTRGVLVQHTWGTFDAVVFKVCSV